MNIDERPRPRASRARKDPERLAINARLVRRMLRSERGEIALAALALHAERVHDPDHALRCITELRRRLDALEEQAVANARRRGDDWRHIGFCLATSHQAAYKKHAWRER